VKIGELGKLGLESEKEAVVGRNSQIRQMTTDFFVLANVTMPVYIILSLLKHISCLSSISYLKGLFNILMIKSRYS
jgi:hypothetical protein